MRVFGASFDSVEENRAFAEKFEFPYPLLCDETRSLGLAFGACAKPEDSYPARVTFLIGPDGVIEFATETPNPAAQAEEILARLADPGTSGKPGKPGKPGA